MKINIRFKKKLKNQCVKIVYGDGIVLDGLIDSQIKKKKDWYFIKKEDSLLQINKSNIHEILYYTKNN